MKPGDQVWYRYRPRSQSRGLPGRELEIRVTVLQIAQSKAEVQTEHGSQFWVRLSELRPLEESAS